MGSRKLADKLREDDGIEGVGRHLVRRYMQEMGIFAVHPKPKLSKPVKDHKEYVNDYNYERPHQSLGYQRPHQVYSRVFNVVSA